MDGMDWTLGCPLSRLWALWSSFPCTNLHLPLSQVQPALHWNGGMAPTGSHFSVSRCSMGLPLAVLIP
jgi:hypothetical protein